MFTWLILISSKTIKISQCSSPNLDIFGVIEISSIDVFSRLLIKDDTSLLVDKITLEQSSLVRISKIIPSMSLLSLIYESIC